MLYQYTENEIRSNTNTGVEYEIALFYCLLETKKDEQDMVYKALMSRNDSGKILDIISYTNTDKIYSELSRRRLSLVDVSFETQNDEVGPADIILFCIDQNGRESKVGLSVKYANTCTLNVTGRKFISDAQIGHLRDRYKTIYLPAYIKDMKKRFGHAINWHRKTSVVTDRMIDEIREAVIRNWPNVSDKKTLLKNLFHDESPIEFWVINYKKKNYVLNTRPSTIDMNRANDVEVRKYQTSYVGFYLDGERVGLMQVKFNNGFIESNFNHKNERKKKHPDFIQDGLEFNFGQPFGSWNFSVEE